MKKIRTKYAERRRVGLVATGVKYGFFVVDEVALATSAHVKSSKAISGGANFGGAADTGTCSAPTRPTALTDAPAGGTPPAQGSGDSAKTDKLAEAAKNTSQKNAASTAGDAQTKQSNAASSSPSVKFSVCHSGANEVTFASSAPLPVAMKLRLIGSFGDDDATGRIDINDTMTALPLNTDPKDVKKKALKALHEKFPGLYPLT